ncbi:hypothetical protein [Pleomorphovibrio marinus]|uniref:hypothetical protein n=1 Tax=Pleomorphovibrio marinus TaxID=2164132 RepID=UPI001E6424B5|nr:hypothetical protein [Pleomorphovibrio marinus]
MMSIQNNLWFEIALVSFIFATGNILLGHFEEKVPKWRRIMKFLVTLAVVCFLTTFFGRLISLTVLGLTFLPVIYIHTIWLPKNGINGWTGEPRKKYFQLRGWTKIEVSDKTTSAKKP